MARNGAAFCCAAGLSLTAACGGESFVLDADASVDSGTVTPASDASTFELPIPCPGTTCMAEDAGTCCTGTSGANNSCTYGGSCGVCNTSLKCARDSNCPMGPCCIGSTLSTTCSGNVAFASTCRPLLNACLAGEARLCNPNLPAPCPAGSTCSSMASDLAKWGLPQGTGVYGVCVAK